MLHSQRAGEGVESRVQSGKGASAGHEFLHDSRDWSLSLHFTSTASLNSAALQLAVNVQVRRRWANLPGARKRPNQTIDGSARRAAESKSLVICLKQTLRARVDNFESWLQSNCEICNPLETRRQIYLLQMVVIGLCFRF